MLYYREEKLKYIIDSLNLHRGEMAKKLETNNATIAHITDYSSKRLRNWHLYAICHAYNIPMEIFENKEIKTTEQIDNILNHSKKTEKIFGTNYKVLEKLLGTWYFYSYHSQYHDDIWQTKTIIYDDSTIEDQHQNRGKLFIGKNQSIILKETHNAQNLNSITFDNNRITYNIFPFSRTSKINALNHELLNFGICSKDKLEYEKAKEILGQYSKVQLKIDHTMLERIYNLQ